MMEGIGEPSPGMVFVEKTARFTPILELGAFFRGISLLPAENRRRGALEAQIRPRRNGLFGAWASAFFLGIYHSTGAPSSPLAKWTHVGGGPQTISRRGDFFAI